MKTRRSAICRPPSRLLAALLLAPPAAHQRKPAQVLDAPIGARGGYMDDSAGWVLITGIYLDSAAMAPRSVVVERLASYPNFSSYAVQVEALLSIMDQCRPWLTRACAAQLTAAAYRDNDAIAQQVEFYGFDVLPGRVRAAAACYEAGDMEAIAAFVLACSAHALGAISPILQGAQVDAVAHIEQHRMYLETIWPVWECATSIHLSLEADEIDSCHRIADLVGDASSQAAFKVDGHCGELERRRLAGSDARDSAIRQKALELIRLGSPLHNLNSKLRAWQQRETGQALSKPAMNAILKKFNLHS